MAENGFDVNSFSDHLSEGPFWEIQFGSSPLVAAAIHDGHAVRREVMELLAVSETDRLHEEDPHTAFWTSIVPTRIVGLRSRFEVDFNRPRDKAVYLVPSDAWGLRVWNSPPPEEIVARSLAEYDMFYRHVEETLESLVSRFGQVVVLDLHSYNQRRGGVDGLEADAEGNPEVNIGTGTMDRKRWSPVVDRFMEELRGFDFFGRTLDVRENIKFSGGQLSKWIHGRFPDSVCSIAVEMKKFFMDEWTGEVDRMQLHEIGELLRIGAIGILQELNNA